VGSSLIECGTPRLAVASAPDLTLLRLPDPYDFELSTARYRRWGPDLANLWEDGALWRAVAGREVRIAPARRGVDVEPLDAVTGAAVRTMLGAGFDLDAFYGFASGEPVLATLVPSLRGLRPPIALDPFESLVTSITAQQVSLHAALAIRGRLIERFGERVGRVHAFPTAERLAASGEDELIALGFSRRKAEYTLALARPGLDLGGLAALGDDEVKARLVALRGVGEWTADWFLARHLGRPRAWPAGDLGLRKAVAHFYGDADVRAVGERLDPFQNLSAHYLLAALYAGVGS
jgi:3-methyladenine DNA glycosylase/8-oxoguanine DNA glycosylase